MKYYPTVAKAILASRSQLNAVAVSRLYKAQAYIVEGRVMVREMEQQGFALLYNGEVIASGSTKEVNDIIKNITANGNDLAKALELVSSFKNINELKLPAREILPGQDIILGNGKQNQNLFTNIFKDIKTGTYGELSKKYIWTIDENGINIGLEQTSIGNNKVIKHSNLSTKAFSGGEVWFIRTNEIHINAWSGRYGAGAKISKEVWEASINAWKSLGYKVILETYK